MELDTEKEELQKQSVTKIAEKKKIEEICEAKAEEIIVNDFKFNKVLVLLLTKI